MSECYECKLVAMGKGRSAMCYDCLEERNVELQAELSALRESEKFYHIRCDELQIIQSRMRDPERQMVCDILANGKPRDKAGIGDYALLQGKGE